MSGKNSTGAYAQCDGGVCFTSTNGGTFPGFTGQLGSNEIIRACPIAVAQPEPAKRGFQIIGPYPCQASYFQYCSGAVANTKNGSTIDSGASTGGIRLFTRLLYGSVPPLNECRSNFSNRPDCLSISPKRSPTGRPNLRCPIHKDEARTLEEVRKS